MMSSTKATDINLGIHIAFVIDSCLTIFSHPHRDSLYKIDYMQEIIFNEL